MKRHLFEVTAHKLNSVRIMYEWDESLDGILRLLVIPPKRHTDRQQQPTVALRLERLTEEQAQRIKAIFDHFIEEHLFNATLRMAHVAATFLKQPQERERALKALDKSAEKLQRKYAGKPKFNALLNDVLQIIPKIKERTTQEEVAFLIGISKRALQEKIKDISNEEFPEFSWRNLQTFINQRRKNKQPIRKKRRTKS